MIAGKPMTEYRLAALDMDGTLLNSDHETTPDSLSTEVFVSTGVVNVSLT